MLPASGKTDEEANSSPSFVASKLTGGSPELGESDGELEEIEYEEVVYEDVEEDEDEAAEIDLPISENAEEVKDAELETRDFSGGGSFMIIG